MKLFYSPGTCALSPHIVLCEAGLDFETERVDLGSKKTATGLDYNTINAKGYVPALVLDDGQVLNEGPVIVQYIADRVPDKKLAPAPATIDRLRLHEWLCFISAELHKGFGTLFNPKAPEEWKTVVKENLGKRIAYVAQQIEGKQYLMGETFSVADAYLFTILGWAKPMHIDLSRWPAVTDYMQRVAARPAVQTAMAAEAAKA